MMSFHYWYWPWIVIFLVIALICVVQVYRSSRTLMSGELRSFLFLLLIANWFPSLLIEDYRSRHYFILLLQAFCYASILWTVFSRISGKQIYIPRTLRPTSPSVTTFQVCTLFAFLFLMLALMVNNGTHEMAFPTRIEPLNAGWTFTFLALAGVFGGVSVLLLIVRVLHRKRHSQGMH